ncbi:MAG TPA: phosphoribosyltransferase family protein [Thermoanaerobaculia bacterium]|nr:phosphoribosyltransferase family protein [Thermoanaerobaculia bacterium]
MPRKATARRPPGTSPLASYGPVAPRVAQPIGLPTLSWPERLGRALVDLLFDDTCLGCRDSPAGPRLGLCLRCHGQLDPHSRVRGDRCSGCAGRIAGVAGRTDRCGACLADPPPWRRLYTLWTYRAPFDAVIHALKFQRLEQLGEELAVAAFDRFADDLLRGAGEGRGIETVVPVPLPWPRRLHRGFNQAESIAAPLAARLGRPLQRALGRRPSPPQSLLPLRRRGGNLRRSLRIRHAVPGASVLLVDDVVTSGATLRAATAALLRAGADEVTALAVAWTPPRPP